MTSGRKLTKHQVRELLRLAGLERADGQWLLTQEQIAQFLDIDRRTVWRHIRRSRDGVMLRGEEHRLRNAWHCMLHRCRDRHSRDWHNYGGRGISVCDEWRRFESFQRWALANGWCPGLQLDRIDNAKGYDPTNCRFVDQVANANNKRNNVRITAFGETKTAAQWSLDARCVVSDETLTHRIRQCPDAAELAIVTPRWRWARAKKSKNPT